MRKAQLPPPPSPGSEVALRGAGAGTRVVYLEPLEADAARSGDSNGLYEIWQLLLANKGKIFAAALLGALAGLLWTLEQTPVYQAKTSLEIQNLAENALNVRIGEMDGTEASPYTPEAFLHTQVRLLQSQSLRDRVMKAMQKESAGRSFPRTDRLSAWRRALGLPTARTLTSGDARLPYVTTHIQPFENTRMLEIVADSTDPEFAAGFANKMANEYIESQLEARWNSAQRASEFLTRQLEEMKVRLQSSEQQLQNYSRESGLLFTGDRQSVDQEKLRQMQDELSRAQADRVAKQSAYEIAASSSSVDAVPAVVDNGRLSGYQAKLADLRRELAELTSVLTPEHYKVARVQAQINELESTQKKERANILDRIRNEYQSALRRENLLATAYGQQTRVVADKNDKAANYDLLRREVDTNRQLYDTLLQKVKVAGLASALRASNARVVDPAWPPKSPYKPSLPRNVALGVFAGMLAGVVFVAAGEHVNRRLKAPGETPFHLKVPELGVIPADRTLPAARRAARKSDPGEERAELVAWQERPAAVAESFRSALASILLSEHNGERPKVILITSAGRAEGKSTTVSNLGIALAEINQKVLLIDADMRKPQLHNVFNISNTWGLSDLLRERNSLRDSPVEALSRATEVSNLYLLSSGPGTVSIPNLLYSRRMAELIARLRDEFDTILIDTPPMLYLADARVLGRLADGAVLVVRAGQTTRDAAIGAKQRLLEDGIPVLGTILNGWDSKAKSRFSYYGYGYGYSYGDYGR